MHTPLSTAWFRSVPALIFASFGIALGCGLATTVSASEAAPRSSTALHAAQFSVEPGPEIARRSVRLAPFRVLNSVDGLPQNSVYAMAEAQDGRIYFGTQDGLSRFDGRHFERIPLTQPERAVAVNTLKVENELLWVGTDEDGLWRGQGTHWEKLSTETAPMTTVRDIQTRRQGGVWVAADSGLWLCLQRCRRVFSDASENGFSGVLEGQHDGANVLWVAIENRGVVALALDAQGEVGERQFEIGRELGLANLSIRALAHWQGALWVGSGRGLLRIKDHHITHWRFDGPLGFGVFDLLVDRQADGKEFLLAATYGGGLVRMDPQLTSELIDVAGGLPENHLLCLMQQRTEGDDSTSGPLWIGTATSGVAREESSAWMAYTERHGLPHRSVIGVGRARFPDGQSSVWLGTISGSVRQQEGRWRAFLPEPLAQRPLYDVAEDGAGGLWLATDRGLFRWRGAAVENVSAKTTEIIGIAVMDMERQGADGPLWLTTRHGMSTIHGAQIKRVPSVQHSVQDGARALHYAASVGGGSMFIVGNQVQWFDAKQHRHVLPADCLVHPEAYTVASYTATTPAAEPELWFGGREGLTRVRFGADGLKCTPFPAHRLASNWVFQLAFDQLGQLYAFGYKGVQRLALADFYASAGLDHDDLSKIPLQQFDRVDGLPDLEFNRGAMLDTDGILWAANVGGAVLFDPKLQQQHSGRSPLIFSQARAGTVELVNHAVVPFRSEIQFQYRLLAFSREARIGYQSQLLGLEASPSPWSGDAGRSFVRLPGGDYRFKVWARDADGREFGPIEYAFTVLKPWWLNPWVILAEGLALVFLGGALGKWRAGHQRRKALLAANRLEREVQLRTHELNLANRRLEQQALTDALTGCYNRRCLYERYEGMASTQSWLAVLIDVDFFKRINDQHGHAVGDEVLRLVAARLRAQGAPVFRMGGEEFLLLEPVPLSDAGAERLPAALQTHAVERLRCWLDVISTEPMVLAEQALAVSVSMGAVFLPQLLARGLSFEQALTLADRALYLAKEGGRNRACLITAFVSADSVHGSAKIADKEIILPSEVREVT